MLAINIEGKSWDSFGLDRRTASTLRDLGLPSFREMHRHLSCAARASQGWSVGEVLLALQLSRARGIRRTRRGFEGLEG